MPTFAAIRARVIEDLGVGLNIPIADIDTGSSSASAIVSTKWFRNPNWHTNHFRNLNAAAHRPGAASSADYWRLLGDLTISTGSVAPGANYSDGTWSGETELNIIYYGIHHQQIDDAINRGMEDIPWLNEVFLSIFADGDMQAANTSSWTGSSGSTLSKVTTAARTPFGLKSLRVQNDSADDYAQSATVNIRQGAVVYIYAIASVDAGGSAELALYDVTNSADIGTLPATAESDEESPTFLYRMEAVPSTCKQLAVRLNGEASNSDIYWNALGGYPVNQRRIFLPSTFNERFKILSLAYAEFQTQDALSVATYEIPPSDYRFLYANPQANPYAIQFHTNKWLGKPLVIQGRRPYSDEITLSAETDTTTCPLHLIAAAASARLLTPENVRSKVPNGDQMYARARATVEAASAIRPISTPAKRQTFGSMRMMN